MCYLLDDFDQIFQDLPALTHILVSDDSCGQVTQNMWAHGLNGIEIPEKHRGR